MILQTGQRTDIPAFYAEWFIKRIKEGFVYVRNPYNPKQILKYDITPVKIDMLGFCTKNPRPMLRYLEEIKSFKQYWFVTITPYGKDIEPNVGDKYQIIEDFKVLSRYLGKECMGWRYDPILVNDKYTLSYHLHAFETIAKELSGYTETVVISFLDLYTKVLKNYPEAKEVPYSQQEYLVKEFVQIARRYGMRVKMCAEGKEWEKYGADCFGCFTQTTMENVLKRSLSIPSQAKKGRKECSCLITGDIGAYNSCLHFCRYCYANFSREKVLENYRKHNPNSPLLIGELEEGDVIVQAQQNSWIRKNEEISLF